MRYNEWKALGSVSDPCDVPSKWWLRKLFHLKTMKALPPPQALGLLVLPPSCRLLCLALAEQGNGLCSQVQRQDQMREEGTLEFWLPSLFLNHLPRSGVQVFGKEKRGPDETSDQPGCLFLTEPQQGQRANGTTLPERFIHIFTQQPSLSQVPGPVLSPGSQCKSQTRFLTAQCLELMEEDKQMPNKA